MFPMQSHLIEKCLSGRFKFSIWGIVPLPRRIKKMPAGFDPDKSDNPKYDRAARNLIRSLKKFNHLNTHTQLEIERHLRASLAGEPLLEHLISVCGRIARASEQSHGNAGAKADVSVEAFKELWRTVNARMSDSCRKCDKTIKKRLALSGFVS